MSADFDNELMRTARKGLGLTQCDLSKLTGIDQSDLSKYERGVLNPSLTSRLKLATALNNDGLIVRRTPVSA